MEIQKSDKEQEKLNLEKVLEEKGFRSSIIEAMSACADKSRNM